MPWHTAGKKADRQTNKDKQLVNIWRFISMPLEKSRCKLWIICNVTTTFIQSSLCRESETFTAYVTHRVYLCFCVVFENMIRAVKTWPTFMRKSTFSVEPNTMGIKSWRQSELMSQSESSVFTLAKARLFPLRHGLIKTTTGTSFARSIVPFQRKDVACHRFCKVSECVCWWNFPSLNLMINSLNNFSLD